MVSLMCNDCGWIGKQEDCVKEHRGAFGTEDVEPCLTCPKCNSESLIELTGMGSRLHEPVLV